MLSMLPGACRESLVISLSTWGSLVALAASRHTYRGTAVTGKGSFQVSGHLMLTLLCSQAAELVTENCEAYEAHMRDVRDYLEERLQVRGTSLAWVSAGGRAGTRHYLPVRETQFGDLESTAGPGGGDRTGYWKLAGIRNPLKRAFGPSEQECVSFSQLHGCV